MRRVAGRYPSRKLLNFRRAAAFRALIDNVAWICCALPLDVGCYINELEQAFAPDGERGNWIGTLANLVSDCLFVLASDLAHIADGQGGRKPSAEVLEEGVAGSDHGKYSLRNLLGAT